MKKATEKNPDGFRAACAGCGESALLGDRY
jgi:hypothetical protein